MQVSGWEIASSLANVATALAAIVGVVFAVLGINAWRAQLRGSHDFDLARRLLLHTYRWRNAIRVVRDPAMVIDESDRPADWDALSSEEKRHRSVAAAYQRRWQLVTDARAELDVERLQAEVVWGRSEGVDLFRPLIELESHLLIALQRYLRVLNPATPEGLRKSGKIGGLDDDDIIYGGGSPDEFGERVSAAIAKVEEELKPRLQFRPRGGGKKGVSRPVQPPQ